MRSSERDNDTNDSVVNIEFYIEKQEEKKETG